MTEAPLSPRRDRQLGLIDRQPSKPSVHRRLDKSELDRLRAGECPFCGAGPFIVPALHVQKMHGVDKVSLRRMVGVPRSTTICDPTHSAKFRADLRSRLKDPTFRSQRLAGQRKARAVYVARTAAERRWLADELRTGRTITDIAGELGVTPSPLRRRVLRSETLALPIPILPDGRKDPNRKDLLTKRLRGWHSHPKPVPIPHGTENGYNNRKCRCDACRQAHTEYTRQARLRRSRRKTDVPHGTASGYLNWRCRCDPCVDAYRHQRLGWSG